MNLTMNLGMSVKVIDPVSQTVQLTVYDSDGVEMFTMTHSFNELPNHDNRNSITI